MLKAISTIDKRPIIHKRALYNEPTVGPDTERSALVYGHGGYFQGFGFTTSQPHSPCLWRYFRFFEYFDSKPGCIIAALFAARFFARSFCFSIVRLLISAPFVSAVEMMRVDQWRVLALTTDSRES